MNDRNRGAGAPGGHQRERRHDGQPSRPDDRARPPATSISSDQINQILEGSPEAIDDVAQKIAESCKALPRSQMRNFFGPIVRLRAELANPEYDARRCARDLYMHSARLTYMSARTENRAASLENSFKPLVQKAVQGSAIELRKLWAICNFAEAIVAYHYPLSR